MSALILVEGPFDVIYLDRIGYYAVALFGCHQPSQPQMKMLKILEKKGISEFVICFDGDQPGRSAAMECAMYMRKFVPKVSLMFLPDGKDVDDLDKSEVDRIFEVRRNISSFKDNKDISRILTQ